MEKQSFVKLDKSTDTAHNELIVRTGFTNLLVISLSHDGELIEANERFFALTGYSREDVIGSHIKKLIVRNDVKVFELFFEQYKMNSDFQSLNVSVKTKQDGVISLMSCGGSKLSGAGSMVYELMFFDVTVFKENEENIQKVAYYDSFTGLPNAALFETRARHSLAGNIPFALILIMVSNFKVVNSAYGVGIGKQYIKTLGDVIAVSVSNDAEVFKTSDDEFAVMISNYDDIGDIGEYAAAFSNMLSKEYIINGINIKASCNIGISLSQVHSDDFVTLCGYADAALIKSKSFGSGRVVFFNKSMNDELVEQLAFDVDLRRALEKNEFKLYYQPQYNIETGRLFGYEALIRWASPLRGLVPPDKFISAAEENRLIIPIGIWAIREAAIFAKKVAASGYPDISVSVNVSVVQISDDGFVSSVFKALDETGVAYKNIKLEITESVMLESIEINKAKINMLVERGIKVALDDFGTGYSSLTCLRQMPLQIVKIDKSFISSIFTGADGDREIITSVIDLAHNMQLMVVAEGIEDENQLKWLKERKCDICQGYYAGRPLTPKDALLKLGVDIHGNPIESNIA